MSSQSRRDFLKTACGAALSTAAFQTLLEGCAGGLVAYRAKSEDDRVIVPKEKATSLTDDNGIMMVHASALNSPLILRRVSGLGIIALSARCSHRGCEVRPLPDSLQCPCHGSEYDIDGAVLEGPARFPLRRFQVSETDGAFIIKL